MFDHDDETADEFALSGLHWMTAGLYAAAGAEMALGEQHSDFRGADAMRRATLVAAPIAAAAHAAHALWPGQTTRVLTHIADGVAAGMGAAGFVGGVQAAATSAKRPRSWAQTLSSAAPLALAAVGLLGLILRQEEEAAADELESWQRRARVVERLVPKRRARLDHIVIHV